MRLLVFALALMSGCGGQSPSSEPTTPAPAPAAASPQDKTPAPAADSASEAPPEDCANACTEIAVCWEEVNEGREYNQGGNCTSGCESGTPDEQKAFFQCVVAGRAECAKMLECG